METVEIECKIIDRLKGNNISQMRNQLDMSIKGISKWAVKLFICGHLRIYNAI